MDPLALTKMLSEGGPWALLSLAILAIVYLWRAYVKARDARDALAEKITDLTEKVVEQLTFQKTSNFQVAEALKVIDRRLENVERAQD